MLGDSVYRLSNGVGSAIYLHGTSHIFEKVSPFMSKADINMGNLECTFSQEKLDPKKNFKPYLAHSSDCVQCLKNANFHILNMANNHTMQYGESTFRYTEDVLLEHDIQVIGTLCHPYYLLKIHNIKFAFLGYSLTLNQSKNTNIQYIEGEKKRIVEDVRSLTQENDHIVVSLHWGYEYIDYPNKKQIDLAHEIIDAGASLVIGHHPHILQGMEHYGKGFIVYSLGNFVFDKPQSLQRKSLILQATFSKGKLENVCPVPIYINDNFQAEIVNGKKRKNIEELLMRVNKKINYGNYSQKRYEKEVNKSIKRMRLQFYIFLLCNFYRYQPKILYYLIKNGIARRLNREKYE